MITKKRIKVLSSGAIWALGGASGPLNYPFVESTTTIFQMIRDGVKVVEVLEDGREIPLTIENHDEDNNAEVVQPEPEVVPELKAVEVTQPPLEEVPKEKKPPVQNPKQQQKNEKKHNNKPEEVQPVLEVEEVEKKN